MAPTLITTAKFALFAVFFASMATGMWANSRMIKRMREAGYRYWLINPMSSFAAWKSIEFPILIVAVLVGVGAVIGLKAPE
jgi:myo-inositol catabolism protein IolC